MKSQVRYLVSVISLAVLFNASAINSQGGITTEENRSTTDTPNSTFTRTALSIISGESSHLLSPKYSDHNIQDVTERGNLGGGGGLGPISPICRKFLYLLPLLAILPLLFLFCKHPHPMYHYYPHHNHSPMSYGHGHHNGHGWLEGPGYGHGQSSSMEHYKKVGLDTLGFRSR